MTGGRADDAPGAAREPVSGAEIGPYRVGRVLGRGGMGVVFEARHGRVGTRAALKVLTPARRAAVGDPAVRRFLSEVDALSRLEHPGLVRILDCGESPEHGPWIAMELVAGELLRARLDRALADDEPLALGAVLRIGRRIASAVAAIHGAGIVHRDLKPDNVMLTPDDEVPGGERVKLLDFGIAKLAGGEHQQTTEGVALGTAGYMAPEQCVGDRDVDDRADVYALGVILFELLTGSRPFAGPNVEVMRQHIFAEPPIDELPELPGDLRELIRTMLAKESTRRPSIAEVVAGLRAVEGSIAGAPEAEPAARASGAATSAAASRVAFTDTAPGTAAASRAALTATVPGQGAMSTLHPVIREERPPAVRRRPRWPWLAAAGAVVAAAATIVVTRHGSGSRPGVDRIPPGMVRIEGARFRMGATEAEIAADCAAVFGGCTDDERPALDREMPAHEVVVSTFKIDAHEVTNRDYAHFLYVRAAELTVRDDKDAHYPRFVDELSTQVTLIDLDRSMASIVRKGVDAGGGSIFEVIPGREDLPVEGVRWDGADRYCRDRGMRLPTEAEWELAARGRERRRFPWGNEPPRCDQVSFGRDYARGCPAVGAVLGPVGSSAQDVTPEGVHDLAGSVLEWVQDAFETYHDCNGCRDPVVDAVGSDVRVMRGGSYLAPTWMTRTTTRSRRSRTATLAGLGFRCATR